MTNLPHRIYIAGPFSGDVIANTNRAIHAAIAVGLKGHHWHCPHAATFPMHGMFTHAEFMALDFTYLDHWATALLYLGPSPGADLELERAKELGLTIYTSVAEIPTVG